jgi:transposase
MDMVAEIRRLEAINQEQAAEIDRLRAEVKTLRTAPFVKGKKKKLTQRNTEEKGALKMGDTRRKPRGAPVGHPPWTRDVPENVDRIIEVDAPEACPCCGEPTDLAGQDQRCFIQEDIVLCPKSVITEYRHGTAWCPGCQKDVRREDGGILLDAPIGPNAKAAALYLRHELRLPLRKITTMMSTLFGIDFVPASLQGFEKKARENGDEVYGDLVKMLRNMDYVHADETHWREDGKSAYVFYAGGKDVAVFHIDPRRSGEAAQVLLGDHLDAVLITDAYAGYNGIDVKGQQSCLAHLVRKASEVEEEIGQMKKPDEASARFCRNLRHLFGLTCRMEVPGRQRERQQLETRLLRSLDLLCESQLDHHKAKTLRKRFLPGARERDEVFTCIRHGTPPTNNEAERSLRPLVIFRKVCMGTRSPTGSQNIAVFSSLTETARRQGADSIELLKQLFVGNPADVHRAMFPNQD